MVPQTPTPVPNPLREILEHDYDEMARMQRWMP